MNTTRIQRTYSSRKRQNTRTALQTPSSPPSTLSSPPATPAPIRPSKRPLSELLKGENAEPLFPPLKRLKALQKPATTTAAKSKPQTAFKFKTQGKTQKTLTQLHFNIDQSILRTCPLCDLTYTKGAPDDEDLHRTHCLHVRQGLEWGREEEKDRARGTEIVVKEIVTAIKLKGNKKKGRIICLPADMGGRLGTKLGTLFHTINLSLSAPELPASVLKSSKAYLFLLPHEKQAHRERIVGCVIAQHISTAMEIVPPPPLPSAESLDLSETPSAVPVDTSTGLFCSPTPLPTPMGISRLFVSSSHRRFGIARALLDAAAATLIHGCPLDSALGQVAFTQPTSMGQAVMKSWGKGGVRVYEE